MGISLKDIFKGDEERLVENKRKTAIKNMTILGIVIFLLLILLIIIRFWGNIDEDRRIAITKDIQNIRSAILSYEAEDDIYPGQSLEETAAVLTVNGVVEEYRYGYYFLSSGDLKLIGVTLNLPDESYIVNYENGDVVNTKGIKYEGRYYFSIDDLVAIEKGETPLSDQVIIINSAADMQKFRQYPNGYFKLSANIDMSDYSNGEGWNPIGEFGGVFDGRGYTISNLKINRPTQSYIGLFGNVKSDAKITNLILKDVDVVGGQYTGALAGNCSGAVSDVKVIGGNVTGSNSTGGLVGSFSIKKMNNCYLDKINVDGDKNIGGAIGTLYGGTITKVGTNGNVTATENVGGLIGLARISDATYIKETFAKMAVNGKTNLGGMIGAIEITSSKNIDIANSYAKGSIQTGESNIGGLFGQIYTFQAGSAIVLKDLYAEVSIVVKGDTSGGVIGCSNIGSSTNISNTYCFWEKALAPGEVLNDVGSTIGTQKMSFIDKTSSEMKMISSFTDWDFTSVWNIEERIDTPTLKWEKTLITEDKDAKK